MCKVREKCDQGKNQFYRNRCINDKIDGISNSNDKITFINMFNMLENLNKNVNIMREEMEEFKK